MARINELEFRFVFRQVPFVPKARARFSGHAYLPDNYRNSKELMSWEVREQWEGPPINSGKWKSILFLRGKQNRRGDLDNLHGSFLDVLQDAGALDKDNLIRLVASEQYFRHSKEDPEALLILRPWVFRDVPWGDFGQKKIQSFDASLIPGSRKRKKNELKVI